MEPTASRKQKIALTIAGLDPSSGAGVTADLRTFAAHDMFGYACPTAITVQSTLGVRRVEVLDGHLVTEVLDTLDEDEPPAGIKLGMLGNVEVLRAVCGYLERIQSREVPVVLDPVIRSTSGADLLQPQALTLLRDRLLPLVTVATPNHQELYALLGEERLTSNLAHAGQALMGRYEGLSLVVTGGDELLPNDLVIGEGTEPFWLRGDRVDTTSTHGTGCAFSSALLCLTIAGLPLSHAATAAKRYVEGALRSAPCIGRGRGPLNLLWTKGM